MDVDRIAETAETLTPEAVLDAVLGAHENARPCFTSSFQAEDMAVLHLLRKRIPDVPVLFLDTGYHFPQTYEYRDRVAKEWSLNLVNVLPVQTVAEQESAFGILNRSDPTRCCQLRKVEPLLGALEPRSGSTLRNWQQRVGSLRLRMPNADSCSATVWTGSTFTRLSDHSFATRSRYSYVCGKW